MHDNARNAGIVVGYNEISWDIDIGWYREILTGWFQLPCAKFDAQQLCVELDTQPDPAGKMKSKGIDWNRNV